MAGSCLVLLDLSSVIMYAPSAARRAGSRPVIFRPIFSAGGSFFKSYLQVWSPGLAFLPLFFSSLSIFLDPPPDFKYLRSKMSAENNIKLLANHFCEVYYSAIGGDRDVMRSFYVCVEG